MGTIKWKTGIYIYSEDYTVMGRNFNKQSSKRKYVILMDAAVKMGAPMITIYLNSIGWKN